ncbi:MAG: tetratricopeptide repeat protein, partial [Planctomycetaceae bacterium]
MPSVAQSLQQALQQHQAGELGDAERTYHSILRLDPRQPDALHLLGVVQHQRGDARSAVDSIRRAIRENPQAAAFHSNLAAAHKALGDLDAARECLEDAVRLDPDFPDAHYNLGTVLKDLECYDAAAEALERTLTLDPGHAEAHNNLGIVLAAGKQPERAIASYRRAIICRPKYAEAYNNLGAALAVAGQIESARECLEESLRLDPDYVQARVNLANSFRDAGDAVTAERHYRAALQRDPRPDTLNNLGVALKDQGRFDEALSLFHQVVKLDPEHVSGQVNRSFVRRLLGEFPAGWDGFEWRLQADPDARQFPQPAWDGSPMPERTLLIHAEQGVGDQVMFASCVAEVAETVGRCILECDPRLAPLLQRSLPGVRVVGESSRTPSLDCHARIAMGSILRIARPTLGAFPAHHSFLTPDAERVRKWRQRLADLPGKLTVGVSWRGGSSPELRRRRTIDLNRWKPILTVPGVTFVNLQYGDCAAEIAEFCKSVDVTIHDWDDADPSRDLDGFAAQTAALDLVISVDNATVHFAGGLGVPCWTLLPAVPDWRWMLKRDDSPWYPCMRLFRQSRGGDWTDALMLV